MNFIKKNSLYIFVSLILVIQLFFVQFYWNDKTSTVSMIVKNMDQNSLLYAKDLVCYNKDKSLSTYKAWGEEPPTFHMVGVVFKKLFGDLSLIVLPLTIYVLILWGLYLVLKELNNSKKLSLVMAIVAMTPSLYIHAARYLPDTLSMMFLVFGLLFFLRLNWYLAFLFFLFSVTTKIIAVVPIVFLCLFTAIYFYKEDKKLFFKLLLFSLTMVPNFIWFYYLYDQKIENPFFPLTNVHFHHTGGSNFDILLTSKYWSKIFQWFFYRGIGLIFLLVFLKELFSFKKLERWQKILLLTSLTFILYVTLIRGPQISATWYSFYYQVFFIVVGARALLNYSTKINLWIFVITLIYCAGFLKYSMPTNIKKPSFKDAPVELPCHFHEALRN